MTKRLTIGFLSAPLVAALGVLILSLPSWLSSREPVLEALVALVIYYSYAALFMVIVGVPLFFVLRRFSLLRWWSATVVGLLVGAAGALSINGQTALTYTKVILAGGFAGLAFWFIARGALPPNTSLERTREG